VERLKEENDSKFDEAVRALEEYIEILKHDLLFLTVQCKPESMTHEISTVKERTG
jgi:hypothetical protein